MRLLLVMILLSAGSAVWADANDVNNFLMSLANTGYGSQGATDNLQMRMLKEQAENQQKMLDNQEEQLRLQREQLQAQQQENNQREWWYNK